MTRNVLIVAMTLASATLFADDLKNAADEGSTAGSPIAERLINPFVLIGHGNWVTGVAFSPDGGQLASGSMDWTVRIWTIRARTVAPRGKAKDQQMEASSRELARCCQC